MIVRSELQGTESSNLNEDSSSELDSESDHSATTDTESHGGSSSDKELGEGD